LIAIAHISNVLGTINNVEEIVLMAHHKNIPVLIDGAQSVGHIPLHVSDLDVDFLVFSAHKMFGPMGTGVLVAKQKHHESIRPLIFGGGAIKTDSDKDNKRGFGDTDGKPLPFARRGITYQRQIRATG
jgi:cysteine desulfurase/selenocysteine lyase